MAHSQDIIDADLPEEEEVGHYVVAESTSSSEVIFGSLGPMCHENGWCVFPQQRTGRRLPSIYRRKVIKWGLYQEERPAAELVDRWAKPCFNENVALILGAVSGNTFALDIDIKDWVLAAAVEKVAFEILGFTPFKRVGNAPKRALVYRVANAEDLPPNISRFFVADDGESASEHGFEILANKKTMTIYGRHHETYSRFSWDGDAQPALVTPEEVPLVTAAQIDAFMEAVQEIRPFHRNFSNAVVDLDMLGFVQTDGVNLPKISSKGGQSWVEEDGLVTDGREKFLWSLARLSARANPGNCKDDEGRKTLIRTVIDEFGKRARLDGRWGNPNELLREVTDKVTRAAEAILDGRLLPMPVREKPGRARKVPKAPVVKTAEGERDRSSDFVRGADGVGQRGSVAYNDVDKAEKAVKKDRKARALEPDRSQIAKAVSDGIDSSLSAFFDAVYGDDEVAKRQVHLLVAPTGSGKTSKTIREIGNDPRTQMYDDADREDGDKVPGPIIFLLPTYNNIEELRLKADVLNLDKDLSDEDLAAQALERNLFPESEIEMRMADLKRDASSANLRTMVYRGKKMAGCQMREKLDLLMGAGIGTAGLCKADRKNEDGESETIYCEYYSTCTAIQQRREIAVSHVVFLPHAFMTMSIPEELKSARAVIADERIFHLFVHTTEFDLSTLQRPRKLPRLTKREREADVDPQTILDDRDYIAEKAREALVHHQCPVNVIYKVRAKGRDGQVRTGKDFVASALRVCGNAITSDTPITPDTSVEDIIEMCRRPTGTQISEEYRFWKIVEERLDGLIQDETHRSMLKSARLDSHPAAKFMCRGDREYRIQYIKEEMPNGQRHELVRISWRSKPNWADSPVLLLDASASPDIIRKLFDGRDVQVHDVPAPLNVKTIAVIDRTFSNMALVAKGGSQQERRDAARTKAAIQAAISMTSSVFGFGRVVVGASIIVRRAINTAWRVASNVDFCHFGAMRGLDFAKNHVAALSIGRMEIPIRTVDGLVAALTYDDDEPEEPFDRRGDGVGPDGEVLRIPVENRKLPMRDGRDIEVGIPVYPGRWAKIIQAQYREEELKQFLGRLRPVYREGEAPIWIAISKVIPEGVIIDDFVALEDLLHRSRSRVESWEAIRVTDGVVHPELFAAARPLVKAEVSDWNEELSSLGFDVATGVLNKNSRYTWGFRPVTFDRGNGDEFAFVRSEIVDVRERVAMAFSRFIDIDVNYFDVISVGDPVVPVRKGSVRAPDTIETDLGSMIDRERDEARISAEAATDFVYHLTPGCFDKPRVAANALPVAVTVPIFLPHRNEMTEDVEGLSEDVADEVYDKASARVYGEKIVHDENHAYLATETMWDRLRRSKEDKNAHVVKPAENDERMGAQQDDDGTY